MENKMDGSSPDHSDSDSGESWILLENNASDAHDVPNTLDEPIIKDEDPAFKSDKDEDTDGISIISDSEPESPTPNEQLEITTSHGDHPTDNLNGEFVSIITNPNPSADNNGFQESIECNELLEDSSGKNKTYIHKRNKKLSTVLNVIVLGSVITAAGVAIGHMWGIRDDCAQSTPSSVNKILSNLYKLQEENAYLRNKIKELTLANSLYMYQRKSDIDKPLAFKQKCRKVFEESLSNKDAIKSTKCVDAEYSDKISTDNLMQPAYEQEFLSDLNKLKNFYKQNKSWLDVEVTRRLKDEELSLKTMKKSLKNKNLRNSKLKQELIQANEGAIGPQHDEPKSHNDDKEKKVSYADSLKSDHFREHAIKRSTDDDISDVPQKKRQKRSTDNDNYVSDDDDAIKKDNRYKSYKYKQEKKKHDRHKPHKKSKSRNKYEQWEMKGGIMLDYDDISTVSSEDSIRKVPKSVKSDQFDIERNIKNTDTENESTSQAINNLTQNKINLQQNTKKDNEKVTNWYENRVNFRKEARKKLEQELFDGNTPNNARWYFQRMQKREQCRTKLNNNTLKKPLKRNMNYKTKH